MNPSEKIQLDKNEPIAWADYLHINSLVITLELAKEIERHLDLIGIYHFTNCDPAYSINRVRVCERCKVEFIASYGNRFIAADTENFICEHCFLAIDLDKEFRAILDDTTDDVCNELSQDTGMVAHILSRKIKQQIAKGFSRIVEHIKKPAE